ncbi:MAG: PH domain-containing protein [Planctomycetota bacterium]|nr:PH domain-containing protein [Planctomycetota bacterium]
MLAESNEGPFPDEALLQLCFDGKVGPKTLVVHAAKTKGQWLPMERLPAAKKRFEEGELYRQQQKAAEQERKREGREEKQRLKEQAGEAAEQQRQAAIQAGAEHRANLPFAKFLTDGQSEATIAKLFDRVQQILTSQENIEYMAVQAKPIAIAPDCIVVTNRRFIVFHQKMLGQMDFDDYLWRELFDARIKEGIIYAALSFQATSGRTIQLDYLSKAQARKIYRIAQEREEAALEERRRREMEERRAGASNVVVNTPVAMSASDTPPTPATGASADDPVARLKKLKVMLDAGLISDDEYNSTKTRILQSM